MSPLREVIDVATARERGGLRLALTRGAPGPWGESAKAIFQVKGLPYAQVAQEPGDANDALYAWTGHRNAPVAVYGNEAPRAGWVEILLLAERLRPDPPLLPEDPEERAQVVGLGFELCGEGGFGWTRRLMLLHPLLGDLDDEAWRTPPPHLAVMVELGRRYGYSPASAEAAPERAAGILRMLSDRLRAQLDRGRPNLVGDRLSAADLWWAAFAALVEPLPEALCPMNPGLRGAYRLPEGPVREALDPALLAHRDAVYRDHLELPVELLS